MRSTEQHEERSRNDKEETIIELVERCMQDVWVMAIGRLIGRFQQKATWRW